MLRQCKVIWTLSLWASADTHCVTCSTSVCFHSLQKRQRTDLLSGLCQIHDGVFPTQTEALRANFVYWWSRRWLTLTQKISKGAPPSSAFAKWQGCMILDAHYSFHCYLPGWILRDLDASCFPFDLAVSHSQTPLISFNAGAWESCRSRRCFMIFPRKLRNLLSSTSISLL